MDRREFLEQTARVLTGVNTEVSAWPSHADMTREYIDGLDKRAFMEYLTGNPPDKIDKPAWNDFLERSAPTALIVAAGSLAAWGNILYFTRYLETRKNPANAMDAFGKNVATLSFGSFSAEKPLDVIIGLTKLALVKDDFDSREKLQKKIGTIPEAALNDFTYLAGLWLNANHTLGLVGWGAELAGIPKDKWDKMSDVQKFTSYLPTFGRICSTLASGMAVGRAYKKKGQYEDHSAAAHAIGSFYDTTFSWLSDVCERACKGSTTYVNMAAITLPHIGTQAVSLAVDKKWSAPAILVTLGNATYMLAYAAAGGAKNKGAMQRGFAERLEKEFDKIIKETALKEAIFHSGEGPPPSGKMLEERLMQATEAYVSGLKKAGLPVVEEEPIKRMVYSRFEKMADSARVKTGGNKTFSKNSEVVLNGKFIYPAMYDKTSDLLTILSAVRLTKGALIDITTASETKIKVIISNEAFSAIEREAETRKSLKLVTKQSESKEPGEVIFSKNEKSTELQMDAKTFIALAGMIGQAKNR